MGLSSSKTTTTSGPSKEALPYLTGASGALQGAYDANKGNLANISGGLSGAFGHLVSNFGNDPTINAAKSWAQGTLTNPGSNPELGHIIDTTNGDVMDRINALFSRAGQTGSSRQIGELGKQLAANESGLRYNDWNAGQTRAAQAAQIATGLGGLDNQSAAALASLGQTAATTPYLGAQTLADGLGRLWGNAQTQTTTQDGGLFNSLLNAGASIGSALIMKSDPRLKDDVDRLGEMSDGLGVYAYRYKGDPAPMIGVMADEVAQLRPWALGPVVDGFATVDYGAL